MTELSFPRRIIIGEPVAEALQNVFEYNDIKKVLIVTDELISTLPFFTRVINTMRDMDIDVFVYSGVKPEPSIEDVYRAYELIDLDIDAVIAIGGGSVIDFGKAIYICIKKKGSIDIRDIAPFNPLGIEYSKPLLIAIPTTSGTGSEATYAIVLTDHQDDKRIKVALANYEVVPQISILDPDIVKSLPMNLTIGTAVDALSHAVESLVALDANPMTIPLSEYSIRLIFKYLPIVKNDPEDMEARSNLHYAATMSGIAFTNAGLGLVHAIGHSLGGLLGIHHGTIVGMVLPYVVHYNYKSESARRAYEDIKFKLEVLDGLDRLDNFTQHILNLYGRVGLPTSLVEYGLDKKVDEDVLMEAAELTMHDPTIVYNPVAPSLEDILLIMKSLVSGRIIV